MAEVLHAWVYVIIPVENGTFSENGYYRGTKALFCAFCKQCRQYFTESIPWDTRTAITSPSKLPRAGCTLEHPVSMIENLA